MQWNSKNIEGHKKLYNFWDFLKFTPTLHQGFSFLGFLENLGFVGYILLFLHSLNFEFFFMKKKLKNWQKRQKERKKKA